MKGTFIIATGQPFEMQSNPRTGTLERNALEAGYQPEEISVETVSWGEWKEAVRAWDEGHKTPEKIAKERDRDSGLAKLYKMAGLTEAEIAAQFSP